MVGNPSRWSVWASQESRNVHGYVLHQCRHTKCSIHRRVLQLVSSSCILMFGLQPNAYYCHLLEWSVYYTWKCARVQINIADVKADQQGRGEGGNHREYENTLKLYQSSLLTLRRWNLLRHLAHRPLSYSSRSRVRLRSLTDRLCPLSLSRAASSLAYTPSSWV